MLANLTMILLTGYNLQHSNSVPEHEEEEEEEEVRDVKDQNDERGLSLVYFWLKKGR